MPIAHAVFAWEGFSFRHPEDWAPVVLAGDRKEGYVRLQGPGRAGCQVRWSRAKGDVDLDAALERYMSLLSRDAKKEKVVLQTEAKREGEGRLAYRWVGAGQGRGALLAGPCGRLFFIEVNGARSDSILPQARSLVDSFTFHFGDDLEPWALFGLEVRLPSGLSPTVKTLQSGRTWLTFRPRGAQIEVGRYGFGKELAERHGLEQWARAALAMPKAAAEADGDGRVKLVQATKLKRSTKTALVRLDELRNQLVCIRVESSGSKWSPEWEWMR